MSKTPVTDSAARIVDHTTYYMGAALSAKIEVVDAEVTRQLETELAKANELLLKTNQTHIENQQLRKDLDGERETNQRLTDELADKREQLVESFRLAAHGVDLLAARQKQLAEARAEIERKNALIEQMRNVLKHVRQCSCSHMQRTTHDMIDAALSAAERG